MRRGIFAAGGALAALGAVLSYWTSVATKKEHIAFSIYRDVPAFDSSVTAIMLGVLVIGVILLVYGLVANTPERAFQPLWAIVPLGSLAALLMVVSGWWLRDVQTGQALLLGSLPILGITLAIIAERRFRVLLGVLLIIASIIPLLYAALLLPFLGTLSGVLAGILTVVAYRSLPAEQEHVSEHPRHDHQHQ